MVLELSEKEHGGKILAKSEVIYLFSCQMLTFGNMPKSNDYLHSLCELTRFGSQVFYKYKTLSFNISSVQKYAESIGFCFNEINVLITQFADNDSHVDDRPITHELTLGCHQPA